MYRSFVAIFMIAHCLNPKCQCFVWKCIGYFECYAFIVIETCDKNQTLNAQNPNHIEVLHIYCRWLWSFSQQFRFDGLKRIPLHAHTHTSTLIITTAIHEIEHIKCSTIVEVSHTLSSLFEQLTRKPNTQTDSDSYDRNNRTTLIITK